MFFKKWLHCCYDCCYYSQIRSDRAQGQILHYRLMGVGASLPPINRFIVGETTGLVFVRGKLDREEIANYTVRTQLNTQLITQVLTNQLSTRINHFF